MKSDKLEEFSTKTEVFHAQHSCAMEAAHWIYRVTVTDSPCTWLARCRSARPTLFLL